MSGELGVPDASPISSDRKHRSLAALAALALLCVGCLTGCTGDDEGALPSSSSEPVEAATSTTRTTERIATTTVAPTTMTTIAPTTTTPDPDAACRDAFKKAAKLSSSSFSYPSAFSFTGGATESGRLLYATISSCTEEQWSRIAVEIPISGTLQDLCDARMGAPATACATADRKREERERLEKEEEARRQDEGISANEFEQVKIGMTLKQVTKIIGSEGEHSASSEVGDLKFELYTWHGEPSAPQYSIAQMYFQNGRLDSKVQAGLL